MRDYEIIRVGKDRKAFAWKLESDDSGESPWDSCDGHGDVSDWTRRDKAPGELVLNDDRGAKRFYDFAGACRIARRDGWGSLPGEVQTQKIWGRWHAWVDGQVRLIRPKNGLGQYRPYRRLVEKRFHSVDADINKAISTVYAKYRATMTARQYAAAAAMRDYEYLRRWCNDQWYYVGVVVAPIDENGPDWDCAESVWGIESDCDSCHQEVAQDLAEGML